MTLQRNISAYISSTAISLLMLAAALPAAAQRKDTVQKNDSVPLFNGITVAADLAGPVQMAVGDYGQYEASLRVNLKDRYFPVLELGVGRTDYTDDVTQTSYKTSAPFGRIGMDFNLLKDKHDIYKLYAGVRYAFTSFKYDLSHPGVSDPVWGDKAPYGAKDVDCSYHWLEFGIGADAKIWGPVHMGWSLRYRKRASYDDGRLGKSWYVPGYGKSDGSAIGVLFNIAVEILRHKM